MINHVRRLMNNWLLISLTLLVWLILAGPVTAAQPMDTITLDRDVTPQTGQIGRDEFTVTLIVDGDSSQCPVVEGSRLLDIVLLLDHSSSMDQLVGGRSKLEVMKAAAISFVDTVDPDVAQVAIVQFDEAANVVQPLSSDPAIWQAGIDSITSGGGTSIETGMEIAFRELVSARARAEAGQIIILLTDGGTASDSAALREAQEARDAGIRVVTIGLGNEIAETLLQQMASQIGGVPEYYPAPDPNQLEQIYQAIGGTITTVLPAATDLALTTTFDATAFELVEGSVTPTGTVVGNQISWVLPELLDGSAEFSYQVQPLVEGAFAIDQGDTVEYNRCGQEPRVLTQPIGLRVAVQAPTPTPTNTLTPTPTETPSPTVTPTPFPTATPTPPPSFGTVVARQLCNDAWWPFCLGLLLLLFFLWWLWKLLQEWRLPANERNVCRWIPWLWLPLLFILLWFILNHLALCGPEESVYFWRIRGLFGNSEVVVTSLEGDEPAAGFAAANQADTCVGCHVVSSAGQRIAAIADGGTGQVVVYDLNGEPIDTPDVSGSFLAWSPTGDRLAVSTGDADIVIVDVVNGIVIPLTGASDPNENEAMPAWSPDGSTIAFVRGDSTINSWTFVGPTDIYTVPASGGTAAPLPGASNNGFNYYPAYSPDGHWLAFTHHLSGTTTYAAPEAEIFLVPVGGGEPHRLAANDAPNGTRLEGVSNSWPTWSLDGSRLAFTSKRNDPAYDIFTTTIDANGNSGPAEPLPNAAEVGTFEHLPYWGIPPESDPWPAILALWPCLIPFFLVLLAWLLCRWLHQPVIDPPPARTARVRPDPLDPPLLEPLWQVAPTVIIGVGGSGRWALTHVKKILKDNGHGTIPSQVKFLLVDTAEREQTNIYQDATGRQEGVEFGGVSLEHDEILLLNQNLADIISAAQHDAALDGWFPHADYQALPDPHKNLANGTHGLRPLVRAALIDKLRQGTSLESEPPGNDAAGLWLRLVKAFDMVSHKEDPQQREKIVRIVFVGSLSGGMSGALFDLAYLARQAGRLVVPPESDGTIYLEAYFTTPGAYSRLGGNQARRQMNTTAAARELQRFQMGRGFPFPMNYAQADESLPSYLRQELDWQLFDNVTLIGGDGHPETSQSKSKEPWATTLASLADVIAFRLDRGTASGDQGDYRAGIQADTNTMQQQRGLAVVSTAGSFVYRLPVADILEIAQARWARKLFHVFLIGDQETDRPSFDWTKSKLPDRPEESAYRWLMAQHEAGDPPTGILAVGYLSRGVTPLSRDVLALANNNPDASPNETFQGYLQRALALILNGIADEPSLPGSQGPRLGYAEAFVSALVESLAQARQQAESERANASAGTSDRSWLQRLWLRLGRGRANQGEWEQAITRLQQWQEIVSRSHASLIGVRVLLVGTTEETAERGVPGVYTELLHREARALQRRRQMDQVAVRRYLWSRPASADRDPAAADHQIELADELYQTMAEQFNRYLGRLYWYTGQDGTVRLGLVGYKGHPSISLDDKHPEAVQQMAEEIIGLAGHLTRDWTRQINLAQVLPTQLSVQHDEPAMVLARQSWQTAQPHLTPPVQAARTLKDARFMSAVGIPPKIQEDTELRPITEAFARRLREFEPGEWQIQVVPSTDRTAITLVREYGLMPMFNLSEMQQAWQVYIRNLSEGNELVEPAIRSTIFISEAAALEYERRLESPELLNQDFRLLHSVVVLALARPKLVEHYVLAFAAGWITVNNGLAHLTLPDEQPIALTLPNWLMAAGGQDARLAGLLRIAANWPDDGAVRDRLEQAVKEPRAATKDAWQNFLEKYRPQRYCQQGHLMRPTSRYCHECGAEEGQIMSQQPFHDEPTAVRDIAALAALAVTKQLNQAAWQSMAVARSRLAR